MENVKLKQDFDLAYLITLSTCQRGDEYWICNWGICLKYFFVDLLERNFLWILCFINSPNTIKKYFYKRITC